MPGGPSTMSSSCPGPWITQIHGVGESGTATDCAGVEPASSQSEVAVNGNGPSLFGSTGGGGGDGGRGALGRDEADDEAGLAGGFGLFIPETTVVITVATATAATPAPSTHGVKRRLLSLE